MICKVLGIKHEVLNNFWRHSCLFIEMWFFFVSAWLELISSYITNDRQCKQMTQPSVRTICKDFQVSIAAGLDKIAHFMLYFNKVANFFCYCRRCEINPTVAWGYCKKKRRFSSAFFLLCAFRNSVLRLQNLSGWPVRGGGGQKRVYSIAVVNSWHIIQLLYNLFGREIHIYFVFQSTAKSKHCV